MLEALQDWNIWWSKKGGGVPQNLLGQEREILKAIKQYLDLNRIITLVGVRRAGKSTILYQIIDYLLKNRITRPENILFINFEDIRFNSLSIDEWYNLYLEELKPDGISYLFFDEIHYCQNWVNFVRSHVDRKSAKIFLTDSSSYLLPTELASILTGRKVTFEIYPVSFKEYLTFKQVDIQGFGSKESALLRGYLKDYIDFGGFAELINIDWSVSKKLLLELFDDIITKDIVTRFSVDYTKIRDLSYYVLNNPGQRMTYRKLKSIFKVGSNVPQKYLGHLEDVFLCFTIKEYSEKVKEQLYSPKKVYPIDTGLINALAFKVSENTGPLLETIVYLELKRRNKEIYHGNFDNKYEVDFIIKSGKEVENIINVSYDLKNEKTRKREIDGLKIASEKLQPKEILLLTWQEEETIDLDGKYKLMIRPLWKWLLESEY